MNKLIFAALLIAMSFSCQKSDQLVVELVPQEVQEGKGPRWSPYGQKMVLSEVDNAFETQLKIGEHPSNQWAVRMVKTDTNTYYNALYLDQNQNGQFEEAELIKTEPSESRGKIWSSFDGTVYTTVNNPWTGKEDKNIYPISLWYVFDPNEEMEAEVLRFSRRGWLEGQTTINGIGANILLAEATMDAKIDTADQWSLAPSAAPKELYDYRSSRSLNDHAWLNDDAYRIVEVHPSGRKIILEAFDPGMTRVEEAEKLDIYAADKKAAHSGEAVSFLHNYQDALAKAIAENKRLFLDFETTWCGPCKIMDQLVYTADDVVKATDQFIAVKIDGDDHPELTKRFDVKAYPTLILLSPDEEVIDRRVGYQSVKATTIFLGTLK